MRLIHQHELKPGWIEFLEPALGRYALHGRDRDVCYAARVVLAQLDLDPLRRIGELAVPICLVDEFLSVGEDEGLCCVWARRLDTLDELGEDDLVDGCVSGDVVCEE